VSRLDPRTTWRGLVGFLRAYPETWGLLALAAATMGVSWLAVGGQSASGFGTVNLAFGALVTIVGMGAVVRLAIRRSLANEAPQRLIVTIFTSYAVLVVSFASTYYVLANAGDLRDARAEVLHYAEVARRIDAGQLDPGDIPEHESRRAFGGMRERLWSGLESVRSAEG